MCHIGLIGRVTIDQARIDGSNRQIFFITLLLMMENAFI